MLLIVGLCFCCFFLYLWKFFSFNSIHFLDLFIYCLSRSFCLMVVQLLSYSVVIEQIVFSLEASMYGMLFFRDLRRSDLGSKNACSSVGLQYKVVWMLLFSSFYSLSRNPVFLGEIWKSNFIVLCFSFGSFMNFVNSALVPFLVINMSSLYLRYSGDISLMYG